ncbi:hypothetical protein MT325_m391L [Paramecium bursaria chlorella virus MT325]|uniref:Uncharacterized protein m391L n=1 Tax=Paramecium bursaria Chlorella virus MT325 TaxID=346932 RepID=A7IUC1_PBCVM|nr:hypothetical protein MT325_m391L [Paramecium bursaria chlorella virus MT325]
MSHDNWVWAQCLICGIPNIPSILFIYGSQLIVGTLLPLYLIDPPHMERISKRVYPVCNKCLLSICAIPVGVVYHNDIDVISEGFFQAVNDVESNHRIRTA